jgi:hypothetical protein
MKVKDIEKLEGRQLDAAVAERVMGADKEKEIDLAMLDPSGVIDSFRDTIWANILPHYSTDIAAAWRVVEKLREEGWQVVINVLDDGAEVAVTRHEMAGHLYEFADTAPLAISRAALRAVAADEGE